MSIGTHEGDIDEIRFVCYFNEHKDKFKKYLDTFHSKNCWMIRVTTKQLSKLSNQKVFTRSDCYLGEFETDLQSLVSNNNYYLTEDFLKEKYITYKAIPFSGISVKMTTSHNYQILKVGPNSFYALFNNYELGAGASLFCLRENELCKNENLLKGWNTTEANMITFFKSNGLRITEGFINSQEQCKQIKNFSTKEIEKRILNSITLEEKIFNGKDLYEEPYTALFFYHGFDISKLVTIPFSVTTGSGRSHGDYTIVLKPING